jgi:nitrite reductase/ring-hydroxylating ferredoxin subunit
MGVAFVPVAEPGELAEGQMKPVDLGGREIIVTMVDGELFAFARECPHEATDLAENAEIMDGPQLRCDGHNYCFDLHTGQCVAPSGGPALAVLPVEEHDGKLCVRLEW